MLLSLQIINDHHIINVLKATCLLNAFASKYAFLRWYLWRHPHVRGAWCIQTSKETRRERTEGMLRLGMGWALASCSWLSLGFWSTPSKNPCPGLIHPSSCRRHPPRVSPYKDEDISFRHPRLWLSSLQLITTSKVTQAQTGLPFQGLSPHHRPRPSPGKCLAPCIFPLKCKVRSRWPSVREDTVWSLKAFESQAKLVERCIDFGEGGGYFLWGSPLGPSKLPKGKCHIVETIQAFLMRFL